MTWQDWIAYKQIGNNKPSEANLGVPQEKGSITRFTQREMDANWHRTETYVNALNESNLNALSPELRLELGMQYPMSLRQFSAEEPALGQNLISLWMNALNDRRAFLMAQDELSRFYIVDQILETLTEDTLNPNERGEIIEFSSDDEIIKDALDAFKEDHNIDNFIEEIIEDLVYQGEYTVRLETAPGQGVTAIDDQVNQVGILALYERGVPSNYLVFMGHDYQIRPANEYAHFVLGGRKMRVRLDNAIDPDYQIDMEKVDPEIRKRLPDYVRVGKPMFFRMIAKLRELQLLENLLVALKLNQITQSKVVAVRVPPTMPPSEVAATLNSINQILNTQTGLDLSSGSITISEIMTKAGRYQAVPNYLDEKGSIMPLNVREDVQVDDLLRTIDNMRQVILSSIGIPYALIYGGEQKEGSEGNRSSEIRRFGRYARKLGKLQRSIAKGIKQIAVTHLRNIGIECRYDSFDVVFKNNMVDVSGLEKMEFDDAKQEMVGRKIQFFKDTMADPTLAAQANLEGWFEWLDNAFTDLTDGIPLFKFSKGYEGGDFDDDEDGFDDATRGEILSVMADKFVAAREFRKATGGELGMEQMLDDDLAAANDLESRTQKIVDAVKAKFTANRARRKLQGKTLNQAEVADFLGYAKDRFRGNRKAGQLANKFHSRFTEG